MHLPRVGIVLLLLLYGLTAHAAPSWPGWRGDGSGVAAADARPPHLWAPGTNVVWRTGLPGEGSSSPIVWGDRIFVPAATDNGRLRHLLCLAAGDGRELWRFTSLAPIIGKTDPKAGYAASTPVTDGKRVYLFFDSPGLMAVNLDGTLAWQLPLGVFKSPYNITSSPVLSGDSLILCCDHNGDAFILAVNKDTGTVKWRTPRKQGLQYSTPLLIDCHGAPQLVVNAATVIAYDPRDGRELWSCRGLNPVVAPSAVWDGLHVYAVSGRNGPALAIEPGGQGDVTDSRSRMLALTGGPYVPSPLALPELLLPGDDGHLRLLAADGRLLAEYRLQDHFTASPVLAGGFVYWPAEGGKTYLLEVVRTAEPAAPSLRLLGVNDLGEKCLASPAPVGTRLFLRTVKALYCLAGEGGPGGTAVPPTVANLAELRARFAAHPAAEGDDIPIRLAVVEGAAALADTDTVPFLKTIALKDPHWDVCEAAAKALAGRNDPGVVAAALELVADSRPFLKILGAQVLGNLGSPEVMPALVKASESRDVLVRIASLKALGRLAERNAQVRTDVVPLLVRATQDGPEAAVRTTAAAALAAISSAPPPTAP